MSDTPDRKETALIPAGSTALTTRSSALVKRGLETLALYRGRIVQFPRERSMGHLGLYDRVKDVYQALGEARGDVTVPLGIDLSLIVYSQDFPLDLSPLALLGPDDLQSLVLWDRVWEEITEEITETEYEPAQLWGIEYTAAVFDWYLEHIKQLKFLRALWLILCNEITDAGLAHVGELTALKELWLGTPQITDAGLVCLKNLAEVERLTLRGCNSISNAGLVHIIALKTLQRLELDGTLINGVGLSYLRQLPLLNSLSVSNAELFDTDIASHIQGLTNLKRLRLEDTHITDNGLNSLRGLTNLQYLDLTSCNITDSGLPFLQDLRSLQSLDLSGTFVSEKAVENLRRELPNCDIKK